MKLRLDAWTAMTGAVIVSVTGTAMGDPDAPGSLTVSVALNVPRGNPAGFTMTEIAALVVGVAVPDDGETCSHEALGVTLHTSVPPPAFAIVIDCAAGTAPPLTDVNDRLPGLTDSCGPVAYTST